MLRVSVLVFLEYICTHTFISTTALTHEPLLQTRFNLRLELYSDARRGLMMTETGSGHGTAVFITWSLPVIGAEGFGGS